MAGDLKERTGTVEGSQSCTCMCLSVVTQIQIQQRTLRRTTNVMCWYTCWLVRVSPSYIRTRAKQIFGIFFLGELQVIRRFFSYTMHPCSARISSLRLAKAFEPHVLMPLHPLHYVRDADSTCGRSQCKDDGAWWLFSVRKTTTTTT